MDTKKAVSILEDLIHETEYGHCVKEDYRDLLEQIVAIHKNRSVKASEPNNDWGSITIKPCPFCGRGLKGSDRAEAIHTERTPSGGRSWIIHCAECDGGCGVEMRGKTEQEVLMKWNRRLSFK